MQILSHLKNFSMVLLALQVQAAPVDGKPSLRFQETIKTAEAHTTEGEGVGMMGVPVVQPHKSKVETSQTITTQAEGKIYQLTTTHNAITVRVLGKHRTAGMGVGMEEGRFVKKLTEIKKTFVLTCFENAALFLHSAEILEQAGNYQLKLGIGFKNLTDLPLIITPKNFSLGQFVGPDSSQTSVTVAPQQVNIGNLVYKLPKLNGGYTLQVPVDTPYNVE